jgi:hypothetical protein
VQGTVVRALAYPKRDAACCGGSRTSSGAACRPRRRAPDRALLAVLGRRSARMRVSNAEPVVSVARAADSAVRVFSVAIMSTVLRSNAFT